MKKLTIISNESEKVMKINIINPLNKKEFNIDIPLKEKTLKNEIDSIITYITSLKAQINNMENRIKIIENNYEEIKYIKAELQNIQDKLFFHKSNIIQINDENVILSWFEKRPKKFNLLLDSKIDGDSTSTFYQKCENKKPTILFFKTTKEQDLEDLPLNFGNLGLRQL